MEEGQSSPASDYFSVVDENLKFTIGNGRRQIIDQDGKLWTIRPYHEGSQIQYVIVNDKGECCYLLLKKNQTLHHRWNAYRGHRKDKKNKCISLKRASLIDSGNNLRLTSCDNVESDLRVKGDWLKKTICIFQDGQLVAEILKMDGDELKSMGAEDGFLAAVYSEELKAIDIPLFSMIEVINTTSVDNPQGGQRPQASRLGHVAQIVGGVGQGLTGAAALSNCFQ